MNLQQFFRILRARWLLMLIVLVVTVGATVTVSLMLPPRYTATAAVIVDAKGIDPISGGLLPLLPMTGYMATQVDVIQSHNVARKAVDLLRLADSASAKELYMAETQGRGNIRDWLAELLLKELRVEPSRESSVINVSYRGNDPRFAAAVANAMVQGYINTNLELRVGPARQTNTFFNEQMKSLKDSVEASQARLSEYQRSQGIIATDERLDVENNRLNELSTQVVAAQAQTYDSLGRLRQVQEAIAKGQIPESVPDVVNNPVIQALKGNLTLLDAKINDLSNKVGKNHPQYLSAQAELAGVRRKLEEEMRTLARSIGDTAALAQKREEQIKASLAAQRAKVLEMKKVRDDLTVLMREAENTQKIYDAAMGRMTQTRLESQTTQTNVMVLNEAVEPTQPSSPKVLLNALIATLLGVMLAVGAALLRETFDRIIRSSEDAGDAVGAPVLGVMEGNRRVLGRWRRGRNAPSIRAEPQGAL